MQTAEVRRVLLRDFEISEISLFADKVFRYGEPESAVIIGRRLARNGADRSPIRYQRIREGQIKEFSRTFEPSVKTNVLPARLANAEASSFRVPDLIDVWDALRSFPKLEQLVEDIGKGFDYKGDDDPSLPKGAVKVFSVPNPKRGFIRVLRVGMRNK